MYIVLPGRAPHRAHATQLQSLARDTRPGYMNLGVVFSTDMDDNHTLQKFSAEKFGLFLYLILPDIAMAAA